MTIESPSPNRIPQSADALVAFEPENRFFVGIDSDGCAFDAMEIKHQECFTPETINDESREVHAQAIRELIARDKNHPSVVLWSIANEPESDTPASRDYFEPLFTLTKSLDPTRPVGFVNVMMSPHGKCLVCEFADVVMLNRYYGWYLQTGDLAAAEFHWRQELSG